ncbi:hypothetical protein [Salinicola peritrichatus]|uniref:hypothetical protein n=1 Tax=Salinicola peritrichatus TaxID=1267424 RepID=UPI000DA12017|nr:hypothetical protein [Salinicola peritrichatus]
MNHHMPRGSGVLPLNSERQDRLVRLFSKWERNKPDDPEKLAEDIDHTCAWIEFEEQEFGTDLTAGEYRAAVAHYRDCLDRAREALRELPPPAAQIMAQNAAFYIDPLGEVGSIIPLQTALTGHDALLRMLSSLANDYLENHAPEPRKRPRYDLKKIRAIANVCEDHGITVGQSDRGHFPEIVAAAIPTAAVDGHRDKIRQAFGLGKYAHDNE